MLGIHKTILSGTDESAVTSFNKPEVPSAVVKMKVPNECSVGRSSHLRSTHAFEIPKRATQPLAAPAFEFAGSLAVSGFKYCGRAQAAKFKIRIRKQKYVFNVYFYRLRNRAHGLGVCELRFRLLSQQALHVNTFDRHVERWMNWKLRLERPACHRL